MLLTEAQKMKNEPMYLDQEENELLSEIENGEWTSKPLSTQERQAYQNNAKYTKSLQEKRQTTIRFSVSDLAVIKAKSKEMGIGYQNLIQALVHNYAVGKIKLEA
jgi:predicted DNA binding CopG/RHH family protein